MLSSPEGILDKPSIEIKWISISGASGGLPQPAGRERRHAAGRSASAAVARGAAEAGGGTSRWDHNGGKRSRNVKNLVENAGKCRKMVENAGKCWKMVDQMVRNMDKMVRTWWNI